MSRPSTRVLLLAVAVIAVLGIGTGGALCKFKYDCGIGVGKSLNDAGLLHKLQGQDAKEPPAKLPPGFRERIVARGFTYPTDFAFLPGGDVLVSEKNGLVLRVTPGRPGHHIVLDLRRRVATDNFRGIMTVAVSPTFARDRTIYVLYVPRAAGTPQTTTTVARFSAFVLGAKGADPPHEHVLIGSVTAPTCSQLPPTADCLSSDLDHDGAQVAFAKDGTLYLATGDGGGHDNRVEPSALSAQDPNALAGKILHITRTGAGLPDNAWWNGNPRANRSKVWAVGLRNPFRVTLDPRTSVPIAGDVGRHAYEEIDAATRGANMGWPCWEGPEKLALYAKTRMCISMYRSPPRSLRAPLIAIAHPESATIVGGTFAPATFPPPYAGAYFFADWDRGWIRFVHIRADDDAIVGRQRVFATGAPGPVALHLGPGGDLYYLALNAGDLRRIEVER